MLEKEGLDLCEACTSDEEKNETADGFSSEGETRTELGNTEPDQADRNEVGADTEGVKRIPSDDGPSRANQVVDRMVRLGCETDRDPGRQIVSIKGYQREKLEKSESEENDSRDLTHRAGVFGGLVRLWTLFGDFFLCCHENTMRDSLSSG